MPLGKKEITLYVDSSLSFSSISAMQIEHVNQISLLSIFYFCKLLHGRTHTKHETKIMSFEIIQYMYRGGAFNMEGD